MPAQARHQLGHVGGDAHVAPLLAEGPADALADLDFLLEPALFLGFEQTHVGLRFFRPTWAGNNVTT